MSHAATNWAIRQRGLKPATKFVLWILCDRHNPDFGCFPTQTRLAEDAEMSISALNDHLGTLEKMGLIHRTRTHNPRTNRRQPTRYILGFEAGFPPEPPPESDDCFVEIMEENDHPSPEPTDGAISGFPGVPSPDFPESHLRNPEYNLVRELLTKPVKEEEDAQAREIEFDRFFAELLTALGIDPNGTLPAWWQGWAARAHVRRWIDELGLTEDRIIETATETRRDHPAPPDGPRPSTGRWNALPSAMRRSRQPPPSQRPASANPNAQRAPGPAPMNSRPSTPKWSIQTNSSPPARSATQSATRCCHAASSRQSGCGRGVCIEPILNVGQSGGLCGLIVSAPLAKENAAHSA